MACIDEKIDTSKEFNNIGSLEKYLDRELGEEWMFRAQSEESELTTTIERYCHKSDYKLKNDCPKIEENIIRQFERVYDGADKYEVHKDKLYCISLMRHYGAPTRLLDFTYSPFIAIYFALEYAFNSVSEKNNYQQNDNNCKSDYKKERICSIWCIRYKKLEEKVKSKFPEISDLVDKRSHDKTRNNRTFNLLYTKNKYTFVIPENPIKLHKRLHLQQGVFLCPGNLNVPFMDNLLAPYDSKTDDIRKITLKITPEFLTKAFEKYYRMNLTRESLFPGLDGFAESMQYQLWLYRKLHDLRKIIK